MKNHDPLSTLVTAFSLWREKRTKGRDPIPQSLRRQAVALLTNYSKSTIISALKISGGQFKQWCETFKPPKQVIDFVPLPPLELETPTLTLELSFTNGSQLCLSGNISAQLLSTLIQETRR
ncbi:MAG: hypothetical protein JKY55_18535 [Aliivibrio sp.]|uniref:hypothetical protein n=1 Tax=Aliivibrio sp. TaxID=1872443 RepID=UPI001A45CF9D|nr:hypothetical protein [Aliivibrio sp.]